MGKPVILCQPDIRPEWISLAYIIPTLGRTTLGRAVDSVRSQMRERDQIFVVGDGQRDAARQAMAERQCDNLFYLEFHRPSWGSAQCDYVTPLVSAKFICYLGDDDQAAPGALDVIRRKVAEHADRPHLFAYVPPGGNPPFRGGSIAEGYVSGQQIVVPNDRWRIPRYANPEEGGSNDTIFIRFVNDCWADRGGIVFHDDIILICERAGHGEMF